MQPYQRAAQATRESGETPFKVASNVGSFMLARIMPFLNTYVPAKLAIQGLNKVDPKFGKLFQETEKKGYTTDEVRSFLKEKFDGELSSIYSPEFHKKAKNNKNIIEQHSPELHTFIDQEVRKGRKPIEAGALAQNDKRFASIIDKLTKQHNTPWSSIIESVYGQGMAPAQNQGQPQTPQMEGQRQQNDKWAAITAHLQNLLNS